MIHSKELSEANKAYIEAKTGLKFKDSSYKNDSTDSITVDLPNGHQLQVFLPNCAKGQSNPDAFEDFTHYSIVVFDKNAEPLFEFYKLSKHKAVKKIKVLWLAFEFSNILNQWLGEQIDTVNQLNATEQDSQICHSHDFCDPNQAMIDAMEKLNGKKAVHALKYADLINQSWELAKKNKFFKP